MKKPVLLQIENELHKQITKEAKKSGMLIGAKYNEVLNLGIECLRLRKCNSEKA